MQHAWKILTATLVLTANAGVVAQTAPATPPHLANFRSFFVPAVGTWPAQVIDYDPAGAVEYQDLQMREFRVAAGGLYVVETVKMRDSRGWTLDGGMLLHGLDPASGQIRTFGFWGAPTDGLLATSSLREEDGKLRLEGIGTDYPKGVATALRSEIRWESPNRLVWRTFHKPTSRAEYLDHVITYTVAAVPVLKAPGSSNR